MKLTGNIANNTETISKAHYIPGHHKMPRIWILVADRHLARFFRKIDGALELIGEAEPSPEKAVAITHHHPESPPSASIAFARDIAAWLDKAASGDVFDRLVLIAAPKMLGDLRKALSPAVHSRVVADVSKDLTKIPRQELENELEKIVWF